MFEVINISKRIHRLHGKSINPGQRVLFPELTKVEIKVANEIQRKGEFQFCEVEKVEEKLKEENLGYKGYTVLKAEPKSKSEPKSEPKVEAEIKIEAPKRRRRRSKKTKAE